METTGWREQLETEASAALYQLQHMVSENGLLEEVHKKGTPAHGVLMCVAVHALSPLSSEFPPGRARPPGCGPLWVVPDSA